MKILERAERYRERDDRVQIVAKKSDVPQQSSIGHTTLTNGYVGYILPLLVELQYIHVVPLDREPDASAAK